MVDMGGWVFYYGLRPIHVHFSSGLFADLSHPTNTKIAFFYYLRGRGFGVWREGKGSRRGCGEVKSRLRIKIVHMPPSPSTSILGKV